MTSTRELLTQIRQMMFDDPWSATYTPAPASITHRQGFRAMLVRWRGLTLVRGVDWLREDYSDPDDGRETTPDLAEAEAVGSLIPGTVSSESEHPFGEGGQHHLLIDIDAEHYYVPSSTPGHGHLYVNLDIPWSEYERFLRVAADIGLIEEGYAGVSIERKQTFLRLPWIRKGHERDHR